MTEDIKPDIVATLEDDTGDRSVDILRHAEGHFTYVEYHRDTDDPDAWWPVTQAQDRSFKTQYAAYVAASRDIDWLID